MAIWSARSGSSSGTSGVSSVTASKPEGDCGVGCGVLRLADEGLRCPPAAGPEATEPPAGPAGLLRVTEAAEDAGEAMTSVSSPTSGMTKSSLPE